MNLYRVNFIDNKPVSATCIGFPTHDEVMNADPMEDDGRIIWLPIVGTNEEDCMALAQKMAEDYI